MVSHRKSIFIKADSEIDTLQGINGLSIAQIEKRAQKITDNTTDVEWRYRSFDGFLGENETFAQRMKKDWKLVDSLGTTHTYLASNLRKITKTVEEIRKNRGYGPMTTIRIFYQQPIETDAKVEGVITEKSQSSENSEKSGPVELLYPPQPLTVSRQTFSGHQFSLFFNPSSESPSFSPSSSSPPSEPYDSIPELNTKWNEEYTIKNEANGYEIKVTIGILQYIEWFGFYEGGDDNPYRIDPVVLHAILTGQLQQPYLAQLAQTKKEIEKEKIQKEIDAVRERMRKEGTSDDERDWLKKEENNLLIQLEGVEGHTVQ